MSAEEWQSKRWGDIATLEYGKALRDYKERTSGVPVFGTNGRIGYTDKALSNYSGVIVGRKGAYRGIHYSSEPFSVIDTAYYLRPITQDVIDVKWAYYELLTKDINSMDSGSAIPSTSRNDFYALPVSLPSLTEQRAIAATLSALDDKIEINNRINKTLEEIAQALFKRWFVDFEFPDENGQPFKSAGGELEESELGPIPKGWKVGNFFNLTNDSVGGDWGKDSTQGKYVCEVFCIRGADIPELDSGKTGKMPTRFILQKNFEAKVLNENDIVIEISGGSPTQSTGRMVLISKELIRRFSNPLICSNFCRTISLKNEIYAEFLYMYLNVLYKNEVFFQFENGTTGIKNLDVNNLFDKYQIVLPNQEIVANFQSIIKESRRIIQENGRETQVLINIRDALLPKLMSGEIRVPIEEVAADV